MAKILYRSTTERKITGLVGGLSEYMDADVNLLRLIAVAIILFSGIFPGLLVYIIGSVLVPEAPSAPSPTAPEVKSKEKDQDNAKT